MRRYCVTFSSSILDGHGLDTLLFRWPVVYLVIFIVFYFGLEIGLTPIVYAVCHPSDVRPVVVGRAGFSGSSSIRGHSPFIVVSTIAWATIETGRNKPLNSTSQTKEGEKKMFVVVIAWPVFCEWSGFLFVFFVLLCLSFLDPEFFRRCHFSIFSRRLLKEKGLLGERVVLFFIFFPSEENVSELCRVNGFQTWLLFYINRYCVSNLIVSLL